MRQVFSHIHRHNAWKNAESVSGPGSTLTNTAAIRRQLPALFEAFSVRSLLDIPCGDFVWMKEIAGCVEHYIGADIVEALIRANTARYGEPEYAHARFVTLNLADDALPAVDVIFCRDCLVHFSFHDIDRALANIKRSGSRYLLTTTFPARQTNADITTGQWRPINLQAAPFNLPEPLRLISEEYTGSRGHYPDKSLGLWEIAAI
jgi:SAM-dependent methyltransferase